MMRPLRSPVMVRLAWGDGREAINKTDRGGRLLPMCFGWTTFALAVTGLR